MESLATTVRPVLSARLVKMENAVIKALKVKAGHVVFLDRKACRVSSVEQVTLVDLEPTAKLEIVAIA